MVDLPIEKGDFPSFFVCLVEGIHSVWSFLCRFGQFRNGQVTELWKTTPWHGQSFDMLWDLKSTTFTEINIWINIWIWIVCIYIYIDTYIYINIYIHTCTINDLVKCIIRKHVFGSQISMWRHNPDLSTLKGLVSREVTFHMLNCSWQPVNQFLVKYVAGCIPMRFFVEYI